MLDGMFINEALDEGFKLFHDNQDKQDNLSYNAFLCSVIRMLVTIYGEREIIDAWNSRDEVQFYSLLSKYGFNRVDIENFKVVLLKFYKSLKKQEVKAIKKKNKYFNLVQKYLVDMMVCRCKMEMVDTKIKEEFVHLLFTANSKDFYRRSTAVLLAYNPYEIDEYVKKQNLV